MTGAQAAASLRYAAGSPRAVSDLLRSLFLNQHRILGTVRSSQTSLVFHARRHLAIAGRRGVAVVVHIEQLRRQRVAAVVPLALVGVHADPHVHTLLRPIGAIRRLDRMHRSGNTEVSGPLGPPPLRLSR